MNEEEKERTPGMFDVLRAFSGSYEDYAKRAKQAREDVESVIGKKTSEAIDKWSTQLALSELPITPSLGIVAKMSPKMGVLGKWLYKKDPARLQETFDILEKKYPGMAKWTKDLPVEVTPESALNPGRTLFQKIFKVGPTVFGGYSTIRPGQKVPTPPGWESFIRTIGGSMATGNVAHEIGHHLLTKDRRLVSLGKRLIKELPEESLKFLKKAYGTKEDLGEELLSALTEDVLTRQAGKRVGLSYPTMALHSIPSERIAPYVKELKEVLTGPIQMAGADLAWSDFFKKIRGLRRLQ